MLAIVLASLLMPVCLYFDLLVASNVNYFVVPGDLRTVLSCSEAFAHSYGVVLILAAIWFASPAARKGVQSILILLAVNCAVVAVLKNVLMRKRPRLGQAGDFESVWETFRGINPVVTELDFSRLGLSNFQSYPSGHAATAIILGVGLATIFPRARYLFVLFALLACGQRIGFQAHYLSDVCAGIIVALVQFTVLISTRFGKRNLLGDIQTFPVVEQWPPKTIQSQSRAA